MTALPQLLISTVLLGGIYALIAVGLTQSGGTLNLAKMRGQVPFTAIRDGTSNTFLFGEKHVPRAHLNNDIGDASIYDGHHHRTIARCAGNGESSTAAGGPWVYDLGKGPDDVERTRQAWKAAPPGSAGIASGAAR